MDSEFWETLLSLPHLTVRVEDSCHHVSGRDLNAEPHCLQGRYVTMQDPTLTGNLQLRCCGDIIFTVKTPKIRSGTLKTAQEARRAWALC